jgi:hypothetical protein
VLVEAVILEGLQVQRQLIQVSHLATCSEKHRLALCTIKTRSLGLNLHRRFSCFHHSTSLKHTRKDGADLGLINLGQSSALELLDLHHQLIEIWLPQ